MYPSDNEAVIVILGVIMTFIFGVVMGSKLNVGHNFEKYDCTDVAIVDNAAVCARYELKVK